MHAPRLSIGLGSLLVALALVVAVGVGSAIAVIPNQGTYSACLTKATGEIRVINYPKVKCVKGERLIKWSQQGPAGAQGPAGPADWNAIPNKPAGFADGVDNGIVSMTITQTVGAAVNINGNGVGSASVGCPDGSAVVSGGFTSNTFLMNFVSSFRAGNGWIIAAQNPTANPQSITPIAYCMTTNPPSGVSIASKAGKGITPATAKKPPAPKRR